MKNIIQFKENELPAGLNTTAKMSCFQMLGSIMILITLFTPWGLGPGITRMYVYNFVYFINPISLIMIIGMAACWSLSLVTLFTPWKSHNTQFRGALITILSIVAVATGITACLSIQFIVGMFTKYTIRIDRMMSWLATIAGYLLLVISLSMMYLRATYEQHIGRSTRSVQWAGAIIALILTMFGITMYLLTNEYPEQVIPLLLKKNTPCGRRSVSVDHRILSIVHFGNCQYCTVRRWHVLQQNQCMGPMGGVPEHIGMHTDSDCLVHRQLDMVGHFRWQND